jgi:hypothetical protein
MMHKCLNVELAVSIDLEALQAFLGQPWFIFQLCVLSLLLTLFWTLLIVGPDRVDGSYRPKKESCSWPTVAVWTIKGSVPQCQHSFKAQYANRLVR